MASLDVKTLKHAYADWKATRAEKETPAEMVGIPQTGFELLYAIEAHACDRLTELASSVGNQVGQSFWGAASPEFTEAVTSHAMGFCDHPGACERIWRAADWGLQNPDKYADTVLDRMLSSMTALPHHEQRESLVYRVFVRDVLLDIALAEAVKHELTTDLADRPAFRRLREFVQAKVASLANSQDLEDILAEVEEGLLGYGEAGGWGKRKAIQQFDRSRSSLAAFVIRPARFIVADAHAPIRFDVTESVLAILERGGFEGEDLRSLVGRSWQTWGGLKRAILKTLPELSSPGNECWLNEVRDQAAVFEAHGVGMPAEDGGDPMNGIAAAPTNPDAAEFKELADLLLDADRFEVFLRQWPDLSAPERRRLRDKFVLLKTIVLRDSIDDLNEAHTVPDGTAQIKFVLVQGLSTLVMGVSGDITPHMGLDAPIDETVGGERITQAGFCPDKLVELGVRQLGETAWDLWRTVYTISFISSLYRVDESTARALASVVDIYKEQEGGFRIPLGWLSEHILMKKTEQGLDRERIIELVQQYGRVLHQFLASQKPLPAGAAALQISAESDSVVVHVAYPHVLLASYAPNAFTTMYWNIHKEERLSIEQMRSKLKALRVSLESLRRFFYEDVPAE